MTIPFGISLIDLIDIIIVSVILYQIFVWLKGTAGMQLLRGLLIIFAVYFLAQQLGLRTLNWLMERFVTIILIVIIIVLANCAGRSRIGRTVPFQVRYLARHQGQRRGAPAYRCRRKMRAER